MMKIAFTLVIALGIGLGMAPAAMAQNHGEVGAFFDYIRLQPVDTNNFGLGGRFSFNVHPNVQLEAEMAYDFARSFNESFTSVGTGGTATVATSHLRMLHGEFGPKFQTGGQAIRAFATVKGGFMNFRLDSRPATFGTFASSVDDLRTSNVNAVLYPGGGVEMYAGILGIRAEIGDEIYFNHGAHSNLRFTVGPSIRF